MKTCSITEAKGKLGKLADAALEGKPTIISRGGKLVVLQAYHAAEPVRPRPRDRRAILRIATRTKGRSTWKTAVATPATDP